MPSHYLVKRLGKSVTGRAPLRYHPEKQRSSAKLHGIKVLMRYRIAPSVQFFKPFKPSPVLRIVGF
jgi:hypothetical protein